MTALWTALYESESKESLASMVCDLRAEVKRLREREKVLKDVPDNALPMVEQVIERCFVLGRFMGSKGARTSLAITCEVLAKALVPNPPTIKFFEKDIP